LFFCEARYEAPQGGIRRLRLTGLCIKDEDQRRRIEKTEGTTKRCDGRERGRLSVSAHDEQATRRTERNHCHGELELNRMSKKGFFSMENVASVRESKDEEDLLKTDAQRTVEHQPS
jgi:hypothetical protein